MSQGYTFLWRKVWSNALLAEPGRPFSRREAWIYITNILTAGLDNPTAGLKRGEFIASVQPHTVCILEDRRKGDEREWLERIERKIDRLEERIDTLTEKLHG